MNTVARLFALITPALLSACSGTEAPADKPEMQQQEAFTAEDVRVARALSISGETVKVDGSPQYRAALCSLGLEAIEDRILSGNMLTREQQRAFAQAQSVYRQRAAAGLDQEGQEKVLADVVSAYPNQGDRARFVAGCLRDLAGPAATS